MVYHGPARSVPRAGLRASPCTNLGGSVAAVEAESLVCCTHPRSPDARRLPLPFVGASSPCSYSPKIELLGSDWLRLGSLLSKDPKEICKARLDRVDGRHCKRLRVLQVYLWCC